MSDPGFERTIDVLTYIGQGDDIRQLAEGIRSEVIAEIATVADPVGTIRFPDPVSGLTGLTRALVDRRARILHIVSHADSTGGLTIDDVWGNLQLQPEALAAMVQGNGIELVVVSTCFGAQIAKALVDAGAARVAVGFDGPMRFGVALANAQGFFRALVDDKSPIEAARDGTTWAVPRMQGQTGELKVFSQRYGFPHDPIFGPEFHIIGTPGPDNADAVEHLIAALDPYEATHISAAQWGDFGEENMQRALRTARIILVLLDDFVTDDIRGSQQHAFYDDVAEAVERGRRGSARVVPLYLSEKVEPPYGLRRLVPAMLHEPGVNGSYETLGNKLKALVTLPASGRRRRRRRR